LMLSLSRGGTKSEVVPLQVLQLPYKNEKLIYSTSCFIL
jgi:hypothetical protein